MCCILTFSKTKNINEKFIFFKWLLILAPFRFTCNHRNTIQTLKTINNVIFLLFQFKEKKKKQKKRLIHPNLVTKELSASLNEIGSRMNSNILSNFFFSIFFYFNFRFLREKNKNEMTLCTYWEPRPTFESQTECLTSNTM